MLERSSNRYNGGEALYGRRQFAIHVTDITVARTAQAQREETVQHPLREGAVGGNCSFDNRQQFPQKT